MPLNYECSLVGGNLLNTRVVSLSGRRGRSRLRSQIFIETMLPSWDRFSRRMGKLRVRSGFRLAMFIVMEMMNL